jgi:hypothetical protein
VDVAPMSLAGIRNPQQNRKSLNYSITSSARARRLDATERPRALAATAVALRDRFDLSQRRLLFGAHIVIKFLLAIGGIP